MVKRSQIAKMGFLRERKIRSNGQIYTYWYWCKRVRSRKKSGGNGKVKSVELCLGRFPYDLRRFAYYCYTRDINIKAFLNEYVRHQVQALRFNIISDEEQQKIRDGTHVHISDDAMPKLTFRAPQGFDLRRQINRQWVEQVRHDVAVLWEQSQSIDRNITYLARLLWHYDQAKEQYSQFQAMLKDYWANPHRVWTEIEDVRNPRTGDYEQREMTYQWKDNAELIIEDNISRHDRAMQWAIEQHENQLELMAQSSPKCDRISFRHQLIGETERRKNDKKLICQWESDFRA